MDTKICTKCGEEKPATTEYFYANRTYPDGLAAACKVCVLGYFAERYRALKAANPNYRSRSREKSQAYYQKNKARFGENSARWRKLNPERARELTRACAAKPESKQKRAERIRRRRANDPVYAVCQSHLKRVGEVLSLLGRPKTGSATQLLGGSRKEIKAWVEALFSPGMSWGNRGRYCAKTPKWNADHIIPLLGRVDGNLVFNFESEAECGVAWNYRNLQPLWAEDNIRKSNRVPHWDDIPKELQDICTPRIRDLLKKVKKTA